MTAKKHYFLRYLSIVALFCVICVLYLGRLLFIQITGNTNDRGNTEPRIVTVSAVRGEIYDRNGKPLVTNRYTYDLTLSYTGLSAMGPRVSNETCLSLLDALEHSGDADRHEEKLFPFEGAYPYYSFSETALDPDSICYYRLHRVLKILKLEASATPSQIMEYYVKTYGLLDSDNAGHRLFDDDEIDRLIRLRYDMDANNFRSTDEYVFAEEIGLPTMSYVKELGLDGVTFAVDVERIYNYPGYASHILGTVGPIYSEEWEYYNEQGYQMNALVGKSGCEAAFEKYLHGSDGKLRIVQDEHGNVVSTEVLVEPIAGCDVYLTIDIDLQIAAEDGLRENVEYVVDRANGEEDRGANANAGAAVVMDPDTFSVLAIASYPTFDLTTYNLEYNDLLANDANPLLNRALNGLYEPGSTFKLGVAAAALSEGKITATSTISCTGKCTIFESYRPECSTYPHTALFSTNRLNVVQAIADSCNVFFYEMGHRLGIDTLNSYMKAFGFGQSTGLELGGSVGVLAGPDYRAETHGALWQPGDVLQSAIGQSDNQTTPMQLACYVSSLVGDGSRYQAHLLDSVYDFGADAPYYSFAQSQGTLLSRVEISDSVRSTVLSGMREVVANNSIVQRWINGETVPVPVGGKTGTAQNSKGCDNALFVCAAPIDDPEIVISVVIEQGYSGSYAALTAGRVLEQYYK